MATQPKPSLHEIAAMPFPASQTAMREHYNPNWGKPVPEDGKKRKYRVAIQWAARGTETYEVEAFSEEEADELATAQFEGDPDLPDDAEWDGSDVQEIKPKDAQ